MYHDFFRLREEPLNLTPDSRYLYMTSQHREALDHLIYGIRERKGFICLTGEVGTGKTTLCRALLGQLGDKTHTALILNPVLSPTQLLRAIVEEFSIKSKRLDKLGYLTLLNKFLLEVNHQGKEAVIIIDEAQGMPVETLEMARLVSNLETDRHKLVQIVLVGQPELRTVLNKPALRQLAQRITVRFHLRTMTQQETQAYVVHRLKIAQVPPADSTEPHSENVIQFDQAAMQEIYHFSQGTPRLINAISDKALLAGYVYGKTQIDRELVRLAARELRKAG